MKYSLVIPCFNSEGTIEKVVEEIMEVMKLMSEESYEIILINDCSFDNTGHLIKDIKNNNSRVNSLSLSRNFGQHAALMAGYKQAKGNVIISLDDDGQTPPNEIIKLINKLNEGYDVVFAKYDAKQHNFSRNVGSKINSIMAEKLIKKPKDLYLSSFFVAKRFVIEEVLKYQGSYPYVSGLLLRTTKFIANETICHRNRVSGKSNYNLKKLLSLWLNGFTAFSIKPLRISMFIGVFCAFFGFCLAAYSILSWILNENVLMGWTSTIAAIAGIGGIILVVLGMIGEYIGRIYISLNQTPQYVIRDEDEI